jgi:hypothetical protein
MTVHAADLLEQSLVESDSAARLPSVDDISSAFEALLERQQDVYDQILLPHLGLGERIDISSQSLEVDGETVDLAGGEIWLFDGRSQQSWLHAPLLLPFEDLDDTLILVHRDDVSDEAAARLRPPIVPGVRTALAELEWLVVDSGGYEGGRMNHDEFLEEMGEHRWYRIDHDSQTSAARFEHWFGENAQSGWSANVYDAFEYGVDGPTSWETPAKLAEKWKTSPHEHAFETAVVLDQLEDPYALLRRLLWQDARLDIDRLGPLAIWKDQPDALFEYSDAEDGLLTDLPAWLADQFDADPDDFDAPINDWFGRICQGTPVELPGVGIVHHVMLPQLDLKRPRPLLGHEAPRTTRLARQHVFAAEPEPDA